MKSFLKDKGRTPAGDTAFYLGTFVYIGRIFIFLRSPSGSWVFCFEDIVHQDCCTELVGNVSPFCRIEFLYSSLPGNLCTLCSLGSLCIHSRCIFYSGNLFYSTQSLLSDKQVFVR